MISIVVSCALKIEDTLRTKKSNKNNNKVTDTRNTHYSATLDPLPLSRRA